LKYSAVDKAKTAAEIRIRTNVCFVSIIADTVVPGSVVSADLCGPVRGGIIGNDQFKIPKTLV